MAATTTDQKRNIRYQVADTAVSQTAKADYDGDQWSAAIGAGYNLSAGPWSYGPVVRLEYVSASVDGYSERMSNPDANGGAWASRLDDMDQESLTSTVGANLARAISTEWGVVLPQLHLGWVHEYKNDAVAVNGSFIQDPTNGVFSITSDKPDTDYFNARIGVSAQFAGGTSAFLYYNKVFGYRDLQLDNIGVGVRLTF
jgi:outer membrane lipase/esterase